MTTPTPERIAAALRLAEALDPAYEHNHADGREMHLGPNVRAKLMAYRATLPKLRSRAEVDAEIAHVVREAVPSGVAWSYGEPQRPSVIQRLYRLCAEPTAREPAPVLCERKDCAIFGPHTHYRMDCGLEAAEAVEPKRGEPCHKCRRCDRKCPNCAGCA